MGFVDNALVAHRNHFVMPRYQRHGRKGEVIMFLDLVRMGFIKVQIFFYSREGASGIEYALVAAMVAIGLAAFVTPIRNAVTSVFTQIQGSIHT
jgi:pilus assembly protein Flp/PilA